MDWREVTSELHSAEWDLESVAANLSRVDFTRLEHHRVHTDSMINRRDMMVAKVERLVEEVRELNMEV